MSVALLLPKLALAGIFVVAGLAKLIASDNTRRTIESFGVPTRLIRPLSTAVPAAELLVAFFLFPSLTSRTAALAAMGLLIVFSAVVLAGLITGRQVNCGCFGRFSAGPAGWWVFVRNTLFLGLAAVVVSSELSSRMATFVAAFTLTACLGGSVGAVQRVIASNGSKGAAPEFQLGSLSGGVVSLGDLRSRGKPILLIFLSAGCSSCAGMYAEIERWQGECRAGLSIAVISGGGASRNRDRVAGYSITDYLLDSGGITAGRYQSKQLPSAVVIDRRGHIVLSGLVGKSAIAAVIERYSPLSVQR